MTKMSNELKVLIIFPNPKKPFPIPHHELLRIASSKAKWLEKTKNFIQVECIHYVSECQVYVVCYRVLDGVLPEGSLVGGAEKED